VTNANLSAARRKKQDEFYTQFYDIEKEMNAYLEYDPEVFKGKTVLLPCDDPEWSNFTKYFTQNFDTLGLKKLISTSYAPNSKPKGIPYQPTFFEMDSPDFDEAKTVSNGKIFTLSRDRTGDKAINVDDLEWGYLDGDGDFRSDEVKALRDEADVIITNPPFSLFRGFFAWIIEADKNFLIIGNLNAITYKKVYPLIKNGKVWLGNNYKVNGGAMFYEIPEAVANLEQVREIRFDEKGNKVFITRVQGVRWFTNLDHGRRHQPLPLMTEADNIKFSKHKKFKDVGYQKYDNYDAIEVPLVAAIPSDYDGVMGVPISFLDKYSPEQFEILGVTQSWDDPAGLKTKTYPTQTQVSKSGVRSQVSTLNAGAAIRVDSPPTTTHYEVDGGMFTMPYSRILIRHRRAGG